MTEFPAMDLSEETSGMQWQAVDSSQIEAIGYESGAEYPLGVKFLPTKKQQAAGLSGSEYHYAKVTPALHARLLAAKDNPVYNNSIGSFFGKIIKGYADLYPFVKVEAGPSDPTPPASTKRKSGTKSPKLFTATDGEAPASTKTEPEGAVEPPSPSASLAVIDSTPADKLFAPGGVTDAQIAAGREWYLTEAKKYSIETEDKRIELKRFARPLQKLRTGIEARAKEFTGETKRKLAAIDTEKRRLVMLVGGIETEVLATLTAWEAEEEARKTRLAQTVNELAAKGQRVYMDSADIVLAIAALESFDVSDMQEYKASAESAIIASLKVLKPELERRKVAERNAAELAELRRKQAERDEQDRIAEEKRQDDERIAEAAEKLAAQKIAEAAKTAETQPYIPAPSEERGAPLSGFHSSLAIEAQGEYAAVGVLEIDAEHHRQVNYESASALVSECLIDEPAAHEIIAAIAKGLIPHLQINY